MTIRTNKCANLLNLIEQGREKCTQTLYRLHPQKLWTTLKIRTQLDFSLCNMLIYSLLKLRPETFFVLDGLSMQYLTMFFVLDSSLSRLHGNASRLTHNKMLKQNK